jgi:hypothetical protein
LKAGGIAVKLYLLLSSGGNVSANPAERAAVMKELTAWFSKIASNLVDGGAAFTGNAKTIASDGKVSDGSEMPTANGYTIIKADSLDQAVSIAKGYPLLKSGFRMTVFETFKDAG